MRLLLNGASALVRATRPKQWTKNLIIYLALFFTVNENWNPANTDELISRLLITTLAFIVFSALSGAVYLTNDILDLERDRQHPKKRFRPIAAGQLPIRLAWSAVAILNVMGLSFGFFLEPLFGWVSLTYVATMLVYSLFLKRLFLLDVIAISAGFILRAVAGAAVLQAPISPWLYICTGLGALFIVLSKRRAELDTAGDHAKVQRDALEWYTSKLLNKSIGLTAIATLTTYSLYTFMAKNLPENHIMMFTIPFVAYGLFRYIHLNKTYSKGENPEDVLTSDLPLMIAIMLWLTTAGTLLVIFR